ncbi:MAG: helix-turn-helix domain-containing protein [Muribaculaceae bacterium]|nr:helix-turn-helix domain-containing protein [Roseburia sp.]MCM1430991.1 helix-turn-helix domain-containing protein [Muribaculaceae bacterium]MCM1493775.1 helix-turn-helix domain-containing protein [Muribaculaceae bacterium]
MLKDNLILLRKINKLSQEEVAEKIGISRQAYGKWEKGETIPDIEKAAQLSALYGTTVDGLLDTHQLADGTEIPPAPRGKNIFGAVTVSERGQLVIPKSARERFGIKSGDRLIVLGDDAQGLALVKEETFIRSMNQMMSHAMEETGE